MIENLPAGYDRREGCNTLALAELKLPLPNGEQHRVDCVRFIRGGIFTCGLYFKPSSPLYCWIIP